MLRNDRFRLMTDVLRLCIEENHVRLICVELKIIRIDRFQYSKTVGETQNGSNKVRKTDNKAQILAKAVRSIARYVVTSVIMPGYKEASGFGYPTY